MFSSASGRVTVSFDASFMDPDLREAYDAVAGQPNGIAVPPSLMLAQSTRRLTSIQLLLQGAIAKFLDVPAPQTDAAVAAATTQETQQ